MSELLHSRDSDRPQCRVTDAQGRRCRARVLWDDAANRPVSTRCETHGGLTDAAVTSGTARDSAEALMTRRPRARAGDGLASFLNAPRTKWLDRSIAGFAALALAAGVLMSGAGPARADFESGVAAYDQGSYHKARSEFEAAAEAGDERALPYLEQIRQEFADTSGAAATAPVAVESAAPGRSSGGLSGTDFGALFRSAVEASSGVPDLSDVVMPTRHSAWSTAYHLPGDATVIGLQHIAQAFDAQALSRDLRRISVSGDKVLLGVLAGIWWLVIVKLGISIGIAIGRLAKAAATKTEIRRYG